MSHNFGLKIDSEKRFEKFVDKITKTQLVRGLKSEDDIQFDEFINAWIPGLEDDNLLIGTDWNAHFIGKEIEPLELLEKLILKEH